MNNNQISNPKTATPTGLTMNDKDYITSILTCLKEMTKNYTTSMTEASNESLHKSFHSIFEELMKLQREVYELMFRKGWYAQELAEQQKITDKYNTLSTEYKDLFS